MSAEGGEEVGRAAGRAGPVPPGRVIPWSLLLCLVLGRSLLRSPLLSSVRGMVPCHHRWGESAPLRGHCRCLGFSHPLRALL